MEEEIISLQTAKLAKEKGYIGITGIDYLGMPCWYNIKTTELTHNFLSYEETIQSPSQSIIQKWLREKHNIIIQIVMRDTTPTFRGKIWFYPEKNKNYSNLQSNVYDTYEQALEESLEIGLRGYIKNE